jgi:acetate kinase
MKILVLNCGSSSVKYQLIDVDSKVALTKGSVERIGMADAVLTNLRSDGDEIKITGDILEHTTAIEYILAVLLSKNHGVITDKNEISAVGHRVVHGAERFTGSVLIEDDVLRGIRDSFDIAPLHNPHNLRGILACQVNLPNIPQVGVFDTAFHHHMPPQAYLYGIPYSLYTQYKIRRYGFHGTSHKFVSQRMATLLRKNIEDMKIITCHLGNGCSMAAVDKGVSVDTTMGFTPLEGLLMGTRSGDMDPSVILYISGKEELSYAEANTLLNKHSGLQGISGVSSDMREIETEMKAGNKRAKLAFDVFTYRVKKYIGAYTAAMGGLDALVFTGGIGENSLEVRKAVCRDMEYFGIEIDDDKNTSGEKEKAIQKENAKTKVYVIPTNEELMIALETESICRVVKN